MPAPGAVADPSFSPPAALPSAGALMAMDLRTRTQALLDLIDVERRRQCSAIAEEASQQAAAIRAQARDEARLRLREAFAQERTRAQSRVAAAQAEVHTLRRLHEQQQASAWLARAWLRLPQALQARWHDAAARQRWVAAALDEATRLLPRGGWRVVHAPGWPADDRLAALQALAQAPDSHTGAPVEVIEDATLNAGLRVLALGNVVDATLGGLTADRRAIGAQLLAAMEGAP